MKSIATPYGPSSSTCGYCSPPGQRSSNESSHSTASLSAIRLSCHVYQCMIDRGWRRSGTYCYKPNLRLSCCPQYTIRLEALEFKTSKSQRKLINRWNRFVLEGKKAERTDADKTERKLVKKSFSLLNSIHASEKGFKDSSANSFHDFETILEPSSFTHEKYALFEKYQRTIHHDPSTSHGFKRFLVNSPLVPQPISYAITPPPYLPQNYGSYHLLYKLDGRLVAMDVLDILPHCVSSVYFVYDDSVEEFSLGKLSVLREILLVREMYDAGALEMNFLYLGFYIYTCNKMRYKGEYSPSYLADPETYEWFPLPKCVPGLEKYRYATFSHPEHSLAGFLEDLPSHTKMPQLNAEHLSQILAICRVDGNKLLVRPVKTTLYWDDEDTRDEILACVNSLGIDIAKDVVLTFA